MSERNASSSSYANSVTEKAVNVLRAVAGPSDTVEQLTADLVIEAGEPPTTVVIHAGAWVLRNGDQIIASVGND